MSPEPVQRRVGRALVRAGADLVVGGHPHWVQGVDDVRGVPVLHSLGNFVFDMDSMRQTMQGVVLRATFRGAELQAIRLVPYEMDPQTFAPRRVRGASARGILDDVWSHSTVPTRVAESAWRQPGHHGAGSALQLRRVDHGHDVAGGVVAGVRRAAHADAREPGAHERPVVAGPVAGQRPGSAPRARRAAASSSARIRSAGPGAADGHHPPTPTRSRATMPRSVRRCCRGERVHEDARAEVVVVVARPARLLGAEGDQHDGEPGARRPRAPRPAASSTPMPEALSSAPGACGTVSRWAPTSSHGRPGTSVPAGGDQVDRASGRHRDPPRDARGRRELLAPDRPAGVVETALDPVGRAAVAPAMCRAAARCGPPGAVRRPWRCAPARRPDRPAARGVGGGA